MTDGALLIIIVEDITNSFMIANQGRQKGGFGTKQGFLKNLICVVSPVMRTKTGCNIIFGSLGIYSANSKSASWL